MIAKQFHLGWPVIYASAFNPPDHYIAEFLGAQSKELDKRSRLKYNIGTPRPQPSAGDVVTICRTIPEAKTPCQHSVCSY